MFRKTMANRAGDSGANAPGTWENQIEARIADNLLRPAGKNPYYKGNLAIKNIAELDENIGLFSAVEAGWVADWIQYLGDVTTAVRIRMNPDDFKAIIHQRRETLVKQA